MPRKRKGDEISTSEIGSTDEGTSWLTNYEWNWNEWENVRFLPDGKFQASNAGESAVWSISKGVNKITIRWGIFGVHTVSPNQDKTELSGYRTDGDPCHAVRGSERSPPPSPVLFPDAASQDNELVPSTPKSNTDTKEPQTPPAQITETQKTSPARPRGRKPKTTAPVSTSTAVIESVQPTTEIKPIVKTQNMKATGPKKRVKFISPRPSPDRNETKEVPEKSGSPSKSPSKDSSGQSIPSGVSSDGNNDSEELISSTNGSENVDNSTKVNDETSSKESTSEENKENVQNEPSEAQPESVSTPTEGTETTNEEETKKKESEAVKPTAKRGKKAAKKRPISADNNGKTDESPATTDEPPPPPKRQSTKPKASPAPYVPIGPNWRWLENTIWYWNEWEDVKFLPSGRFYASNSGSKATWTVDGEDIVIYWGKFGEHKVRPNSERTELSGSRWNGIECKATLRSS